MCEHCSSEGCVCGSGYQSGACQAEIIGVKTCSVCGCQSQPWWAGINLSGRDDVMQLLWDLNGDDAMFPATKDKVLRTFSGSPEDLSWLTKNLPDETYSDAGDILSHLISRADPIEWHQQPTERLWEYSCGCLASGQRFTVAGGQVALTVSAEGQVCDVFTNGSYTVSAATCPVLATHSRKTAPGYENKVFDGSLIFMDPNTDFELVLRIEGETKALRRIVATGVARAHVSSPKHLIEGTLQKSGRTSENMLSALQKYCSNYVKKEMVAHEFEELKDNTQLLEKTVGDCLKAVGLEPTSIHFDYVGDPTGMFASMKNPALIPTPAQIEALRKLRGSYMTGQQPRPTTAATSGTSCKKCGSINPPTSKFCGNCGAKFA
jgi:hypothetical protein